MLRIVRLYARLPRPATATRSAAVIALAMVAGGCSAGFEMPSLNYSGGPSQTSSVPVPREPVYQNRGGGTLGDERGYGQPYQPPYGQPYSPPPGQPHAQPYNPPDSGFGRTSRPTYERGPALDDWRESDRGTPISPQGERGARVAGLSDGDDRGAGAYTPPAARQLPPPAVVPYRSIEPAPVAAPAPPRAEFDPPSLPPSGPAGGDTIEVVAGDTLYALSKKHGVTVAELKRANNLNGPHLRIGQKLVVPSNRPVVVTRRVASLPTVPMAEPAPPPAALPPPPALPPARERPEPRLPHHEVGPIVPPLIETDPATSAATPPPVPAAAPARAPRITAPADESGWTGTHTVARGEHLFDIARKYGVGLNELERVNKITDPRRVRVGTVLKVPRPGHAPAAAAAVPPPASVASDDPPAVAARIINARTRTAALTPDAGNTPAGGRSDAPPMPSPLAPAEPPVRDAAAPAVPKAVAPASKFRWPARGKIISGFKPSENGLHDGINIALPRGAEVHAAEAGIVTYAGDGVPGYGNLLIVRHDGGWITTYAHNDSLSVQQGTAVRRGQVIAKAGATGSVDTPQLRFEIRQGVTPVDPIQHLER